ncbi:prepilin-type N-terminal cleavage/methylation domain-containing protein [Ottowia testudinis]|uniref:Prepilin-type N-terminal cleavage/methylation domain-containing protein n=2 Tax=Ottowia testudinis TaxID=2816950 RepID=A0A975CKW2_9BURK|nr:prepilin-type N-terminal cleavage/methylation domain-containing protein [Ottowia testudinis]
MSRVGWSAHTSQYGFSLLEALVAMAIASIAFAALYRTVGQSAKAAVDVDARIEASLVAQSVLASASFAEDFAPLQAGQAGAWRWSLRVVPEQVLLQDANGQPLATPAVPSARVELSVVGGDSAVPILNWTAWKPYRAAP